MLFSLIAIPVKATEPTTGMTFWDWLTYLIDSGDESASGYGGGTGRNSTAYSDYVSSVQSVLGTSTVGDNCIYLGNWSFDAAASNTIKMTGLTTSSGSSLTASYSLNSNVSSATDSKLVFTSTFVAPVTGSYVFTPYSSYTGSASSAITTEVDFSISPDPSNISTRWYNTGSAFYSSVQSDSRTASLTADTAYTFTVTSYVTGSSGSTFNLSAAVRMEYPTGGLSAAAGTTNISTETRTGSLCGDYFYEGDNGTMVQAENIYLFDETTNTVTNPATGTTATASSWTYDYKTRTYTIKATDGSTYTVVSGDDAAAVTIKDSGNISTTYNYYYGTTTGGGSSGGDTESIWMKLGKLFGSITDGFLEVLKAFIGKLLDGLTSLLDLINSKIGNIVNSILSLFDNVPKLFTGFTAFLTAVFPFLPQEFFDILILGAALAAVILIIKMLKK